MRIHAGIRHSTSHRQSPGERIRATVEEADTTSAGMSLSNPNLQFPIEGLTAPPRSLPRTLVFGSVGDHTAAVESWFGADGRREHRVAIVYYGQDVNGPWASYLRRMADYFAVHAGGKFQNLLWWAEGNGQALSWADYVIVADDDIRMTPVMIGRMAWTAEAYDLPVASASHAWSGRPSPYRHMMARGGGRRAEEFPAGVELCNFVEMTCPLFETATLTRFLPLFRRYATSLTGWGADWLITNACYSDTRPFGVLHNVTIENAQERPGLPRGQREINLLQPAKAREKAWLEIVARDAPAYSDPADIRSWLPSPRVRCISMNPALDDLQDIAADWSRNLGLPIRLVQSAECERTEVKAPVTVADAEEMQRPPELILRRRTIASVLYAEMELCGPEGTMVIEAGLPGFRGDDLARLFRRFDDAKRMLPGVEVLANRLEPPCIGARGSASEQFDGGMAACVPRVTWFRPAGLRWTLECLLRSELPIEDVWKRYSHLGKCVLIDSIESSLANG